MNSLAPTVESLATLFVCEVCHDNVKDATICPNCSKLYCKACMKTPTCPDCNVGLQVQEVVQCRWADEVQQKIGFLQKTISEASALEKSVERCRVHERAELSIYCDTCNCCICHECALWSQNHTGHTFKPFEKIYAECCERIRKHFLPSLKSKRKGIHEVMRLSRGSIKVIKDARGKVRDEAQKALEQFATGLEAQYTVQKQRLQIHESDLAQESLHLCSLTDKARKLLWLTPTAKTVSQCVLMLQNIDSVLTEPIVGMPSVVTDVQSYLVPDYDSKTFPIENYSLFRRYERFVITDPLSANGLEWRLNVIVSHHVADCVNRGPFLGIILELISGPPNAGNYEGSIELLYQGSDNSSKDFKYSFSHDFNVGKSLENLNFYGLDSLESNGFLNKTENCILLRLNVRPPTFHQRCRDLNYYTARLEEINRCQSNKLKNLRRQTDNSNLFRNTLAARSSSYAGIPRARQIRRQYLTQRLRRDLQAEKDARTDGVFGSDSAADDEVALTSGKLATLAHCDFNQSTTSSDGWEVMGDIWPTEQRHFQRSRLRR